MFRTMAKIVLYKEHPDTADSHASELVVPGADYGNMGKAAKKPRH